MELLRDAYHQVRGFRLDFLRRFHSLRGGELKVAAALPDAPEETRERLPASRFAAPGRHGHATRPRGEPELYPARSLAGCDPLAAGDVRALADTQHGTRLQPVVDALALVGSLR